MVQDHFLVYIQSASNTATIFRTLDERPALSPCALALQCIQDFF